MSCFPITPLQTECLKVLPLLEPFSPEEIKPKTSFPDPCIYPMMTKLLEMGLITRLKKGQYEITQRGKNLRWKLLHQSIYS